MHNANTAHEVEIHEIGQPDRLFGICQTVGDSLGFNPVFLRVGLIGILFFSPALMVGAYLGLGLVVGASLLLFPKPAQSQPQVAEHAASVERVERVPELLAA
jgi:phage shock protein C